MKDIWTRILFVLTLHCDKATHLASDALDRKLLFHERWALRLHTLICWSCRHFRGQLALLHDACEEPRMVGDDGRLHSIQMSEQMKARLRAKLAQQSE